MAKKEMKHEEWIMPDWMEKYRDEFVNTGGNTVEELMNWHGTMDTNMPMACLSMCVSSQVSLLMQLKKNSLI